MGLKVKTLPTQSPDSVPTQAGHKISYSALARRLHAARHRIAI